MTNNLPTNLQDRYEVRDGFIIKKGETDPGIFAAMESIKADMAREAARRKAIREGRIPTSDSGASGISVIATDPFLPYH